MAAGPDPMSMRPRWGGLRDRFNAFIDQNDVAWELVMAALAIVFLVVGLLEDDAPSSEAPSFTAVELLVSGVFLLEFSEPSLRSVPAMVP